MVFCVLAGFVRRVAPAAEFGGAFTFPADKIGVFGVNGFAEPIARRIFFSRPWRLFFRRTKKMVFCVLAGFVRRVAPAAEFGGAFTFPADKIGVFGVNGFAEPIARRIFLSRPWRLFFRRTKWFFWRNFFAACCGLVC